MDRFRKFFLTPAKPIFLNKMVAIILIVFSVFSLLNTILQFLYIRIFGELISSTAFGAFSLLWDMYKSVFSIHLFIISVFLAIAGIMTGIALLYKKEFGRISFIWLNVAFVTDTIFMIIKFYHVFRDMLTNLVEQHEAAVFLHQFSTSMTIVAVIFILLHGWIIWRYLQPDLKEIFH